MKKSEGRKLLILGIILVVIDQIVKVLVKTNMGLGEHFDVIGNWFKILLRELMGKPTLFQVLSIAELWRMVIFVGNF